MRRFLPRAFVVLWAALGCAGVGVIAGWWWLDRALDRFHGTAPTVRVVESNGEGRCAACELPRTMDHFSRMLQREYGEDLPSFVARRMRCAESDAQRLAFVTMLVTASRDGDAIATRALEAIASSYCATLGTIAGTEAAHAVATTRACVDLAMGYADVATPGADMMRAQVFRFAQRLTLVAASVADPAMRMAFCADAEQLPADAYDRIVVVQPDLPSLIERACAESLGDSDIGWDE